MSSDYLFLALIIVAMVGMMWWQSRKAKAQRSKAHDFRESLTPGTPIATVSGMLGTIVSVDLEKEQAVIESEGTRSLWRLQYLTKPPIIPAYIHDKDIAGSDSTEAVDTAEKSGTGTESDAERKVGETATANSTNGLTSGEHTNQSEKADSADSAGKADDTDAGDTSVHASTHTSAQEDR